MKRLAIYVLLSCLGLCSQANGQGGITAYTISTVAGGGLPVNIPGTSASLYGPQSVAVDKTGNVFFVDQNDVLRLDVTTGLLTLVAGNGAAGFSGGTGPATSAQLNLPEGVAVDSVGNLYIADVYNVAIRKVSNGVITTVAGNGTQGFSGDNGPATSAELNFPGGIAVDTNGNVYFTDGGRIRKVSNGVITTVAGNGTYGFGGDNGPATSADISPAGVATDSAGNLYIADSGNNRIRKVSNGVITTVAGNGTYGFSGDNGPATSAELTAGGVAVDSVGNLYIADIGNNRIRKVVNGVITTVAGNGTYGFSGDNGPATSAELTAGGVAVDSVGNLYIADIGNNRIRKVVNEVITTVAGNGTQGFSGDNGPATGAELNLPAGVAADSAGRLYIADNRNSRIRKVTNGVITTVAGNGTAGYSGDNGPATSAELNLFAEAGIAGGIAVDSAGNLYIADIGNNRIRKVVNGVITTVAGNGTQGFSGDNGPATSAQLSSPSGIALDSAGNLYIADDYNGRVRKVSNGVITTVAGGVSNELGDNGPATSADISPTSIALDFAGNLYIADYFNDRIRKVANGVITTVAGNGTQGSSGDNGPAASAQISGPNGIAVDPAGNLYIADGLSSGGAASDGGGNVRIRKVTNGVITTVAGNGTEGFSGDDGPATNAQLNPSYNATGVLAVDSGGNVYIADTNNNRIRLLTPSTAPVVTQGGVVPVYSTVSTVEPGEWVSIYGTNLASSIVTWNGNFPTSLGGTSVTINGKAAYLSFVSPTQINLQAPNDTATGSVPVVVTTAGGTATSTVTLAQFGPSFLLLDSKHVAGLILRSNGSGAYGGGSYDLIGPTGNSLGYPTVAAKVGDIIELFAVGLGPTNPAVPSGQAFSGAAAATNPVTVRINNINVTPAFAGLSGAGLYQINLTVPAGLGTGDVPLVGTVGGVQTPSGVVISLQL